MSSGKKACVYFHQGWTDIIMCLPLINYYSEIYDYVEVIIRDGAKQFVDFYTRKLNNVNIIYVKTDQGRFYGRIEKQNVSSVTYIPSDQPLNPMDHGAIQIPMDYEIMFHAEHDGYREDEYKHDWVRNWVHSPNSNIMHFSEAFYTNYNIDFMTRVEKFYLDRDIVLENIRYEEFIHKYGTEYVIYHDDENNHLRGGLHKSTKIEFDKILENTAYVNLNGISNILFDYIKILQNAKEIHLIDSIWGVLCYQLDAKYRLFADTTVRVHCKRNHYGLFNKPMQLKNWIII